MEPPPPAPPPPNNPNPNPTGEIKIEIHNQSNSSHSDNNGTFHTIQLQSPGGSSHFVEGIVVTAAPSPSPLSSGTLTTQGQGHVLGHGNTIIVDNEDVLNGVDIQVVTNENGETILLAVPKQNQDKNKTLQLQGEQIFPICQVPPIVTTEVEIIEERPKRKAALKAAEIHKGLRKQRKSTERKNQEDQNQNQDEPQIGEIEIIVESPEQEEEDKGRGGGGGHVSDSSLSGSGSVSGSEESQVNPKGKKDERKVDQDLIISSEDEEMEMRRCVVCLRKRRFTEDVFDTSKQLYHHIDVLISHLHIQAKGTPSNTGVCLDCMDSLQRWHVFNCAIVKRQEEARSKGVKIIEGRLNLQQYEVRVYKNFKRMAKVKEVFDGGTHRHYARRHLTEKDWDFFSDHLFRSHSVKSEKSKELEKFLTSRKKLLKLYCTLCQTLVQDGKPGYTKHMEEEHHQSPVLYPCDICGHSFPDKDMTASTEDYYPHWISHFYFNNCTDCSKRFPTKRALGQHRHAVHKNRQVKCDKCGKILANKMSYDLHQLRHMPESEKWKFMMKCKICKKKIAQWNLKCHMATHNEERPWKCDHCDATFKMKGALVSHRDVVHFNLKNHVCVICGDAFKSASSLRGHVRRHEGRKDFKCEVCQKEYYTYSALKGHKVVHQTIRNHICSTCGKAFKKKKALDEHVTLHTGVKPHKCPICGREVRVKSNLYKHMKIHKKSQGSASAPSPPSTITANANATSPQNTIKVTTTTPRKGVVIHPCPTSQTQTILPANATPWPPNGTMMVTLDNGTVVSDVTPLVVSFVTTGPDGLHTPIELNNEQHAQLINAVTSTVQSQSHSAGITTGGFISTTPSFHSSSSGTGNTPTTNQRR